MILQEFVLYGLMNLQADFGMCQQGCQRGHTTSCQPLVLWIKTPHSQHLQKWTLPRDPITLSDDEQGVNNHLQNVTYLASNTILRFGDWGSLRIHMLIFEVFSWGNPWKTPYPFHFASNFHPTGGYWAPKWPLIRWGGWTCATRRDGDCGWFRAEIVRFDGFFIPP